MEVKRIRTINMYNEKVSSIPLYFSDYDLRDERSQEEKTREALEFSTKLAIESVITGEFTPVIERNNFYCEYLFYLFKEFALASSRSYDYTVWEHFYKELYFFMTTKISENDNRWYNYRWIQKDPNPYENIGKLLAGDHNLEMIDIMMKDYQRFKHLCFSLLQGKPSFFPKNFNILLHIARVFNKFKSLSNTLFFMKDDLVQRALSLEEELRDFKRDIQSCRDQENIPR